MQKKKDSEKLGNIISHYPYCIECLDKSLKDPEFQKWLKQKLYETTGYRHKLNMRAVS